MRVSGGLLLENQMSKEQRENMFTEQQKQQVLQRLEYQNRIFRRLKNRRNPIQTEQEASDAEVDAFLRGLTEDTEG